MNVWRAVYGFGLVAFVAVPVLLPFGELASPASWVWTAEDGGRLWHLGRNTFALTVGTVALSLPLGVGLAVLLFRTTLFARQFFLFLLALALFVPLPIIVTSWQGFFGADGLAPLAFLGGAEYRPWVTGMRAAIWIHALAAIPWITFIVGLGLTWVEPELEDEAAQIVGPWRVLFYVTLPRVRASILAAALFVVLQTAGEISVTDMMLVSTLAEEVHTQFTLGDRAALARTLVVSLPGLLLTWLALSAVLARLEKTLPPLLPMTRPHHSMKLGSNALRFLAAASMLVLIAVPLVSLVWKVGLAGEPRRWHIEEALHFLQAETRVNGQHLVRSLALALGTGFGIAGLAVVGCWLARDRRWFRWLLFSVLTWAWVLPGPLVGIGLKNGILLLPEGPWKEVLYYAPSPAPGMWAQMVRVLPMAVVALWPVVRMIPKELFEEARLGGAGALAEFRHVVWPMTRRAAFVAALAASALCLGEVSASMRVETPGWTSFANLLFDHMHRGVDNTLAALCVLMLGGIAAIGLASGGVWKWMQGRD